MISAEIDPEGWAKLQKAIEAFGELEKGQFTAEFGRFFDAAGEAVLRDAAQHAPFLTGELRGSLSRGGAGNVWVRGGAGWNRRLRVGTSVSAGSFPHPRALNYSKERFHYQGTTQLTQGWFSDAGERAQAEMASADERLADEILNATARRIPT